MARHVDALTAATLKDLREQWWDAGFSEFLRENAAAPSGSSRRIPRRRMWQTAANSALGQLRVSSAAVVSRSDQPGARDPDGGGVPIAQLPLGAAARRRRSCRSRPARSMRSSASPSCSTTSTTWAARSRRLARVTRGQAAAADRRARQQRPLLARSSSLAGATPSPRHRDSSRRSAARAATPRIRPSARGSPRCALAAASSRSRCS